jgi:hypothetical protein
MAVLPILKSFPKAGGLQDFVDRVTGVFRIGGREGG